MHRGFEVLPFACDRSQPPMRLTIEGSGKNTPLVVFIAPAFLPLRRPRLTGLMISNDSTNSFRRESVHTSQIGEVYEMRRRN